MSRRGIFAAFVVAGVIVALAIVLPLTLCGNAPAPAPTPTPTPTPAPVSYEDPSWLDGEIEKLGEIQLKDQPQEERVDPVALLKKLRQQAADYLAHKEKAVRQAELSQRAVEIAEDLLKGEGEIATMERETAERWQKIQDILYPQ